MPPSPKHDAQDFETALKELEKIVAALEKGNLSLDAALKEFERGIVLTRLCQTALKKAELKVEMLAQEGDQQKLAPFESKDE